MISTENALRYVAHEAHECRNRDMSEALCLLMPGMVVVCGLSPMDDIEARAFRFAFNRALEVERERPWQTDEDFSGPESGKTSSVRVPLAGGANGGAVPAGRAASTG